MLDKSLRSDLLLEEVSTLVVPSLSDRIRANTMFKVESR